MSEAWDRVRRRHQLAAAVLKDVGREGPSVTAAWRGRIDAEYGDDDLSGFLRDVQAGWNRTFDARLDVVMELGADDLPEAVAEVERLVAEARPAAGLLLRAYADHPALAAGDERHRRMVLAATGVDLHAPRQHHRGTASPRSRRVSRIADLRRRYAERRRHRAQVVCRAG